MFDEGWITESPNCVGGDWAAPTLNPLTKGYPPPFQNSPPCLIFRGKCGQKTFKCFSHFH